MSALSVANPSNANVKEQPVDFGGNMDYPRHKMSLITSNCDAMRIGEHQMARITPYCDAMQATSWRRP